MFASTDHYLSGILRLLLFVVAGSEAKAAVKNELVSLSPWSESVCNCVIYSVCLLYRFKFGPEWFHHVSLNKLTNITDSCLDQLLLNFLTKCFGCEPTEQPAKKANSLKSLLSKIYVLVFVQIYLNLHRAPRLLLVHKSYPNFQKKLANLIQSIPLSQWKALKTFRTLEDVESLLALSGLLSRKLIY